MPADIVTAPHQGNRTVFLSGAVGTGKTSIAVRRLIHLLEHGVPAEQILILVPQRTLAGPYYDVLHSPFAPTGGQVDVATIGGLARRGVDLFWPLISAPAGFAQPDHRPHFLTLETAQYTMDRIVDPFQASGAFDGITIPRARLVSQIIDDLNKAAAVGFPPDEISARLRAAWSGESARGRIYDQVQATALAFRQMCLDRNLLDWSLQIEVFWHHLLPLPQFRRYLLSGYRHLIVDNTEEDIPVTHDLLRVWLPLCESALVIHDTDGGYRLFLGADPKGALALADLCRERVLLTHQHVASPDVEALGLALAAPASAPQGQAVESTQRASRLDSRHARALPHRALVRPEKPQKFHPQMLDWVADRVSHLVQAEGMPPGEIAILAPFLSDALRFTLGDKLERFGISVRTHRPSRQLGEEPAARCLLTLAKLAHPSWHRPPHRTDVAHALDLSIADLDPVRARLLAEIVYRMHDGRPSLSPFHQIVPETQERISYLLGGRYDELRAWIGAYSSAGDNPPEPLDRFLSRLFGEILSQPGFGFYRNLDGGAVAANLIASVRKFREGVVSLSPLASDLTDRSEGLDLRTEGLGIEPGRAEVPQSAMPDENSGAAANPALEYVDLVDRGLIAAQYVPNWTLRPQDAVLLLPAYTFLMMNQPVTVQFWLDAGSGAWSERIYQPLTHPYVLRRDWPADKQWADEDEVLARQESLRRLVLGLARRCRKRIYLAYCELNERGYEQQGMLLQGVQRVLRRAGESGGPSQEPVR